MEEPPLLNSLEQSPKCHCSLDNVVTGTLQMAQDLWAHSDTITHAENQQTTAQPQGTSQALSVSLCSVPALKKIWLSVFQQQIWKREKNCRLF